MEIIYILIGWWILWGISGAKAVAFVHFFALIRPHAMSNYEVGKEWARRRDELGKVVRAIAAPIADEHPYAYDNLLREMDKRFVEPPKRKNKPDHIAWQQHNRAELIAAIKRMPSIGQFQTEMQAKRDELIGRFETPDASGEYTLGMSKKSSRAYGIFGPRHNVPITIPEKLRLEHMYLIGRTGAGKTNTFTHLILQDMRASRGIAVIAPMNGLFEDQLLPRIPKHRLHDVVYLNLNDTVRPITINPLEVLPGENPDLRAELAYSTIISAIGEIGGQVMEVLFSEAINALVERPGSTLLDIERLVDLHDTRLREEIVATTKNPYTKRYWGFEFDQLPSLKTSVPFLLNRLNIFRRHPFKTFLCSPKSSINLRDLMDAQKILLFNLSPGKYGERIVNTIGQILTTQFQLAMWSRERLHESERVPFFVYIDEFAVYLEHSAKAIPDIMARARQLKVGLVLAHQDTSQISGVLPTIVGNASVFGAFNVDAGDANFVQSRLINLDWGKEIIDYGGNKADYRDAIATQIQSQKKGQGFMRIGTTSHLVQVPLVDDPKDMAWAQEVKAYSALNYGLKPGEGSPDPVVEPPAREPDTPPQQTPKRKTKGKNKPPTPPPDASDFGWGDDTSASAEG